MVSISSKKRKNTFFSPTNDWSSPAASTIKWEEREFVVDSGASMHMVSRKDLNSAELETVRISKSPTNGDDRPTAKCQQKKRQQCTSGNLDLFVTVMLLEDTPAVLSLGKLCEDHIGPVVKNHNSSKNGRRIECNTANYVPFVVPCLSTCSSSSSTPTSPTSSSQEAVTLTQHPASIGTERV